MLKRVFHWRRKKASRDGPAGRKRTADDDTAEKMSTDIWNPHESHVIASSTPTELRKKAGAATTIALPQEIARQQAIKALCHRIDSLCANAGLGKLPNSVYETWQFSPQDQVHTSCLVRIL